MIGTYCLGGFWQRDIDLGEILYRYSRCIWHVFVTGSGEAGGLQEAGLRCPGRRGAATSPPGGHASRVQCSYTVQGRRV